MKVTSKAAVGNVVLPAQNETEVAKILDKAQKRRCVKQSDRCQRGPFEKSHALHSTFQDLIQVWRQPGRKLNICDLASSERLSKSNANAHVGGALLKETKHINSSLSALSNVV